MDRLKGKGKSQGRPGEKELFPTLRSTIASYSKPLLTLTKVQLDSKGLKKELPSDQKPRSISGQFRRYSKYLPACNSRGVTERNHPSTLVEPMQSIDAHEEMTKQLDTLPSFQKAKISFKSYGIIRGYSANSSSGPSTITNEDRICIVTNLNRSGDTAKKISYFAVYDGKNGCGLADFLRDKFHYNLAEEHQLLVDPEAAIRKAMARTFRQYYSEYRQDEQSSATVNLVLIVGDSAYCVQTGEGPTVISIKLGEQIKCINDRSKKLTKAPMGSVRPMGKTTTQPREYSECSVTKLILGDTTDFLLFGSEGLSEGIRTVDLARRVWTSLLRQRSNDLHSSLGEAADQLMQDAFARSCAKNISVILLAFGGVQSCLLGDNDLKLPHTEPRNNQTIVP